MTDEEQQQLTVIRASLTAALITIDMMMKEEPKTSPLREAIMETMGQPECDPLPVHEVFG